MKKIVFNKIIIEGYRNFQTPTAINIDRPGVTLVKGVNEAGKTTIWDALYFCLEGQNFSGLNKEKLSTWEEKRTNSYRGTRVVVDFTKGDDTYRVARHINFKGTTKGVKGGNTLMLFKNNNQESTGVTNTQAEINLILGMSAKVFMNSIIFGQRMTRLIKAKDAEKRELFDEIFSVLFIPRAKENGKIKINQLSTDLSALSYGIDNKVSKLDSTKQDLEEKRKLIADFESDKNKDLKSIDEELVKVSTDTTAAKKELVELNKGVTTSEDVDEGKLETKYKELKNYVEELETIHGNIVQNQSSFDSEIEKSKRTATNLEHQLEHTDTKCLHCEQNLPKNKVESTKANISDLIAKEKEVIKELEKNKKDQGSKIPEAQKNIKEAIKKRDVIKEKYDKINDTLRANIQHKADIRIVTERITSLDKSKRAIDIRLAVVKSKKPIQVDLEFIGQTIYKLDKDIEEDTNTILQKTKEKNLLDWWVSKAFSNTGLKAHVFNSMLNRLNMYMEQYANVLGSRVRFSVDLSKASSPFITTVYREDKVVEYEELSGGAQQRVDICLAFACHDLVSQTNNINLLIMDEIMEGLDAKGIEQVFGLIRMKAKTGDSIYIISHLDNLNSKESGIMTVTNDGINSYVQ